MLKKARVRSTMNVTDFKQMSSMSPVVEVCDMVYSQRWRSPIRDTSVERKAKSLISRENLSYSRTFKRRVHKISTKIRSVIAGDHVRIEFKNQNSGIVRVYWARDMLAVMINDEPSVKTIKDVPPHHLNYMILDNRNLVFRVEAFANDNP